MRNRDDIIPYKLKFVNGPAIFYINFFDKTIDFFEKKMYYLPI